MSLITMGYGHLTIMTLGLGNSVKIYSRRFTPFKQYGEVHFEKVDTTVKFEEEPVDIAFEKSESEDIAFDKSEGIKYG
jgi:hypothetical protein